MKGAAELRKNTADVCEIFWQYLIAFLFWKLRPS